MAVRSSYGARRAHGTTFASQAVIYLICLLLSTTAGSSLVDTVKLRRLLNAGEITAEQLFSVDVSACPKLRIAIVNQVTFHIEVLAGLLHIFDPIGHQTDVFVHPWTHGSGGMGAWDILRPHASTFYFLNSTTRDLLVRDQMQYDLVILVSPEYNKPEMQDMLSHMRPRTVVVYFHNIGGKESLDAVIQSTSHPGIKTKLVTLSTHTTELLQSIVGQPADTVLAAYPFIANHSCHEVPVSELLGSCLRGFCVQGTLETTRRGYGVLWEEMKACEASLTTGQAAQLFHVNVMGKGYPSAVGVPEDMQHLVTVSANVPFPNFYDTIHHSLAIIPALSSQLYLRSKFTSSILSSLITGTPLVANRTFLSSYQMLSEDSVYLREDSESEIDAMMRIVNMPVGKIRAVRGGLLYVRRRLNQQATAYFSALLRELCSPASSGGR